MDIKRRITDEFTRSTAFKEVVGAWSFTADEYRTVRSLTRDQDMGTKMYRFLAHYVAPTANSEFGMFNDTKLEEWKSVSVPESQKWLVMPEEDPSIPVRMIDVDTGNMVEIKNYGPLDQYCILSHTWKGLEIDYEYFTKAQRSEFRSDSKNGDIGAVAKMSEEGARKALQKLKEFLQKPLKCGDEEICTVKKLLEVHFQAQKAERDYPSAAKKDRQAFERWTSALWEAEYYRKYQDSLRERRAPTAQPQDGASKGGNSPASKTVSEELDDEIENLKRDAKESKNDAFKERKEALNKLTKCASIIDFFVNNRKIVYAIEDLLLALYYRKSARKLQGAVNQAKEIFEGRPFPNRGRRYVWLDNCCIKKSNAGELTESLARMGEWYANADFCLVHVDTPPSDDEWIQDCNETRTSDSGVLVFCARSNSRRTSPAEGIQRIARVH